LANSYYYAQNKGLASESDYPYTGKTGSCDASSVKTEITIKGYDNTMWNYASSLLSAIVDGPVSTFINGDSKLVQGYKSGILNSDDCGKFGTIGTLAVGYGEEGGARYYIVQNFWGTGWGEKGYIRIATREGSPLNRANPGVCGI